MFLKPGRIIEIEVHLKDPPLRFRSCVKTSTFHDLEIFAPSFAGKRIGVPPETRVSLKVPQPGALFIVESSVREVKVTPHPIWRLLVPSLAMIKKVQRRVDHRYSIDLPLACRRVNHNVMKETIPLRLINISADGALVSAGHPFRTGDEMLVDLTPVFRLGNGSVTERIVPHACVVRQAPETRSTYGIRFEGLDRRFRVGLMESVRKSTAQTN